MPPALSDDESGASSGDEEIPYRAKGKAAAVDDDDDDVPAAEDGDGEPDEFVVENIIGHRTSKGQIEYDVKWLGYDDPKDRTWEPEANLDGALEVLHEYWEEIGGRPEVKGKKRKGRKSGVESGSGTPASSTKRLKKDKEKEKEWSPPPGSWENDVEYVDTVEESPDPQTGGLTRYAYLVWNNHRKTQHPLTHVYHKCPQKMLIYYESHLVFTQQDSDDVNGADKEVITKGDDDAL